MCFSSLVNILFVNLRYYLVYVHLYLKEVLYSLSGASVCAFKICVESKNFIRWFFQSQILSWSVSTYIRSVRGVIQLIRSKCVRFQDFSRANTSPPPPSSLFASTNGSFFFQKTNSNLNPCSASLFASNTKIFLQHYPVTILK